MQDCSHPQPETEMADPEHIWKSTKTSNKKTVYLNIQETFYCTRSACVCVCVCVCACMWVTENPLGVSVRWHIMHSCQSSVSSSNNHDFLLLQLQPSHWDALLFPPLWLLIPLPWSPIYIYLHLSSFSFLFPFLSLLLLASWQMTSFYYSHLFPHLFSFSLKSRLRKIQKQRSKTKIGKLWQNGRCDWERWAG